MPGGTQVPSPRNPTFAYRTVTFFGWLSHTILLVGFLLTRIGLALQPLSRKRQRFGLFPFRSPLLWESRLISVPPATEMFQFTGFAPSTLYIQVAVTLAGRVSPFGYLRIKARLPAPRSFSQAATSFIACNRQGIHHMHLFT